MLIYGIIPVDDSVEEYFQPNLPSELPLTFEKQTLPFWNTSPSFVSDSFTTLQNVTSTPPTRPSGLPPRPSQDIWPTHYNLQQRANFIRFNLSHPELQQQKRREQQRQQQQHQQQLHQQLYWKPRPEVTFLPIQNNPFQLATPPPLLDPLNSFLNFLRKNTPSTETETGTEKDRVMKMEMNQFEAIERDRRRDNLMQSERKRFQAAERKKRKDEVLQSEMNRFQAEERERRMSCKETERERKTNEATERERETDEELEIVISDIDETKEREREMDEELEIEISEIDEAIERERETNKATERERETIKEENFEYIEFEMDSNEDNVEFKMESKEKNEKNKATLQHQEKEGDIYIFELEMEDEKTEQEKTEEEKTKQEKTEDEEQMDQPRVKQKRKNPHTPGSGCFCLRCRFFKIKNV